MGKKYINLLKFLGYDGTFSSIVNSCKDLESEIETATNSDDRNEYGEQLKNKRINFWNQHSNDITKLIDELITIYSTNNEEIMNKFNLAEHFILAEQILRKKDSNNNFSVEQLNNVTNILTIHQEESKGFEKELEDSFKKLKEDTTKYNEEQRIRSGNWEKNDIITAIILNETLKIKNDAITFKVINKNEQYFTILYNLGTATKPYYKLRDIAVKDCTILKLNNSELYFPENEELIKNPSIINDYIESKYHELVNEVKILSNELEKRKHSLLYFSNFNHLNISKSWEWEANLSKIKNNLSEEMQTEIKNGKISFDFTEESKNSIQNADSNLERINISFTIIGHTEFNDIKYSKNTPNISFTVNRGNELVKKRLGQIKASVNNIKSSVVEVNKKTESVFNELNILYSDINELLKGKLTELDLLSNHKNLSVHQDNGGLVTNLVEFINMFMAKLNLIKKDLLDLKTIERNDEFFSNYYHFIKHYEQATEVTPSDYHKFLYWDKNLQIINSKLKENTGIRTFEDYKILHLSKLSTLQKNISKQKLELQGEKSSIQFKKLSWWQKIKGFFSWTWKKTNKIIEEIKKRNKINFSEMINNDNNNNVEWVKKIVEVALLEISPCDQYLLEKQPKSFGISESHLKQKNLFRQDSSLSLVPTNNEDLETVILDENELTNSFNLEDIESEELIIKQKKVFRQNSTDSAISLDFENSTDASVKDYQSGSVSTVTSVDGGIDVEGYSDCDSCNENLEDTNPFKYDNNSVSTDYPEDLNPFNDECNKTIISSKNNSNKSLYKL